MCDWLEDGDFLLKNDGFHRNSIVNSHLYIENLQTSGVDRRPGCVLQRGRTPKTEGCSTEPRELACVHVDGLFEGGRGREGGKEGGGGGQF